MKSKILGLLAVGLLAGPMAANALSVTWDDLNPTVVRPTSGATSVAFSATVSLATGESFTSFTVFFPCLAPGSCLTTVSILAPFIEGYATRFTIGVASIDALGLYNVGAVGTVPSSLMYSYIDAAGASRSETWDYSVNVVDGVSVPEPGTLALLGLGLAGLSLSRRRKAN